MEKFAGYGFSKVARRRHALLAYQTAYMKAHHAAAFMAANMSAVADDTDKLRQFRDDAVANGIAVLPPEVNASVYRFVPVDLKTVRYGLGGVRGTGQAAIESVLEARKAGPFKDLFDFCRRVDKRLVNRRCVEALIRAGAFDALEPNRASLLASAGRAIEAAEQAERAASQTSLFGEAEATQNAGLVLVPARPWDLKQRLTEEKAALGYCLSGHLFSVYERELADSAHAAGQDRLVGRARLGCRRGCFGAGADDAPRPNDGGRAGRRQRAPGNHGIHRAVREAPRQGQRGSPARDPRQGATRQFRRRQRFSHLRRRLARSRSRAHASARA
jgi:DNA polymerase-3 subunit alpha